MSGGYRPVPPLGDQEYKSQPYCFTKEFFLTLEASFHVAGAYVLYLLALRPKGKNVFFLTENFGKNKLGLFDLSLLLLLFRNKLLVGSREELLFFHTEVLLRALSFPGSCGQGCHDGEGKLPQKLLTTSNHFDY